MNWTEGGRAGGNRRRERRKRGSRTGGGGQRGGPGATAERRVGRGKGRGRADDSASAVGGNWRGRSSRGGREGTRVRAR